MLELNSPQKLWGVAHPSVGITRQLFAAELFVFRSAAQDYIDKAHETLGQDIGLYPVLLDVRANVFDSVTQDDYQAEQEAWQAKQKAKRQAQAA